ncbi:transfer protein [Kitasatospora sp. NPDC057936]|uniref:transfer protein n=1 Tax=Kitasatospora sp. NPDC057936 TaxID=3346283 RepID=UPI0036DA9044
MNRIYELTVEAPPGDIITYDPVRLADAMRIDDPSRLAIEAMGSRALVTVYPSDPLADVRLPDPELLAMDEQGRIWIGRYHNGRKVYVQLYDPASGSAQRLLVFGTTGAGKSTLAQIILAAMKRSGIATFYGDLKEGQSAPEARGNVDWSVYSQEGVMAQLHTAWCVMKDRAARYAAAGRSKFLRDRPDPLLYTVIDEANRLLEKGAPYRDEATFYIKDIGRTGRSLGVGIALLAQAGHLDELGGSDTMRAMLKEGEVLLLRWTSSMMQQLVADGLLPPGQKLAPIPKRAGATRLISQFETEADDDRPGTQGTGYRISGPYPGAKMRAFNVGTPVPTEGLDPEILTLYGDGPPAALEKAAWPVAGRAYVDKLDSDAAYAAAFTPKDGEEGRGGDRARGRTSPAPAGGTPQHSPQRTIADRVMAVLETVDGPMDAHALLEAVNADGGRPVKLGSIRNALSDLR